MRSRRLCICAAVVAYLVHLAVDTRGVCVHRPNSPSRSKRSALLPTRRARPQVSPHPSPLTPFLHDFGCWRFGRGSALERDKRPATQERERDKRLSARERQEAERSWSLSAERSCPELSRSTSRLLSRSTSCVARLLSCSASPLSRPRPRLLRLLRERERARNNDKDDGICGVIAGWEEYFDYIFPDDAKPQALKILEMAQKWKKQKVQDDE